MKLNEKLMKMKTDIGITTETLAELSGVPKGTINKILNGETQNPTAKTLAKIASALGKKPDALYDIASAADNKPLPDYDGIVAVRKRRVPVLGTIAAGKPIYAEQDLLNYASLDDDLRCDFALRVKGSSMVGARIRDGDIVFIRCQDDVDDGQIAAVAIDNEATLKRVYHIRNGITLVAENPDFPPMTFTGEDCCQIRVLGKAVAFQSAI